jgi:predicted outer membrane repeat protein
MPLGRRTRVSVVCLIVLLASAVSVQVGQAAARPTCLVSNERTRLGTTSLQEAIDAATPGDTLTVKGTCVGNFGVTKALTLEGVSNKAFGLPTLDGGGGGVVLAVGGPVAGFEVTVENLTIRNGLSGIDVGGASVALSRTTVRDHVGCGISGSFGGANLTDSAVRGNGGCGIGGGHFGIGLLRASVTDNGGFGVGVGQGSASITDSVLTRNGGGGVTVGLASATISNSTVSENRTTQSGGGVAGFESTVTIADSTVTGNTAVIDGGGVAMTDGFMVIERSTISGNTAGRNGGGIFASGSLSLSDSAVIGNTATSGGGIFYDVSSFGSVLLSGLNTFLNNVPDDCVGVSGC